MANADKETKPQPGFHLFRSGVDKDSDHEIRWLTGQKYIFFLDIDFEEQAQIKRWCEENCNDTIAYLEDTGWDCSDKISFYSESDAAAFKLRWL